MNKESFPAANRTDLYVAPGQAESGLSYDPGRPIEDQLVADGAYLRATKSCEARLEDLRRDKKHYDDMFGPGTDEAADRQKQIDAIEGRE